MNEVLKVERFPDCPGLCLCHLSNGRFVIVHEVTPHFGEIITSCSWKPDAEKLLRRYAEHEKKVSR